MELYIPPEVKKPEKGWHGYFLKGNKVCEGNTWDKIYNPETIERQRLRVSQMVKKRSKESYKNNKGSHPRAVYCNTNGKIYESIRDASRDLGLSDSAIGKVCKGYLKQVRGFRFEYYYKD